MSELKRGWVPDCRRRRDEAQSISMVRFDIRFIFAASRSVTQEPGDTENDAVARLALLVLVLWSGARSTYRGEGCMKLCAAIVGACLSVLTLSIPSHQHRQTSASAPTAAGRSVPIS